ncbi:MAG TPA: acyl-CoA dehydrogenase family protein [Candidatus Dormibacteraeota bacterium]|jgi:alkylation response protein AidB-like acyl-CoA dehydrogenase
MQRTLMEAEHDLFRSSVRAFVEREVVPHHPGWERAGIVPRELWLAAGRSGFLGLGIAEEHGGSGVDDFRYNTVVNEELTRAGASGVGFPLHTDVVAPYLTALATDEQKRRWLPGFCSGELISAIAMSEPGAGSDLQGIRTTATANADGWVLNGQKTFITNGINADLVVVVARTDAEAGHRGISLLVVERGMPGFERGRNLDKIGLHAQDTAELFLSDVHVPRANLLGVEGGGFGHLMDNLPQERLTIAVSAVAGAEAVLALTVEYCRDRTAFGRPIGSFQHNRFALAEMATEVDVARVFVDRCVAEHCAGRLGVADAAKAKWWTTELQKRVVDQCVQLHGGYGYMTEFPVARAYLDARVATIYGGTTEIMKEIIGRSMGF